MPHDDLDIEQPAALVAYLRRRGHIGASEQPRITPLAGGVSNRTVLVERNPDNEASDVPVDGWVLKQALAKLRVAVDWFSDPRRVHREAVGIRWLGELAPAGAVPRLVFEDEAHHLLAMTAVPRPHENWKAVLLNGRLEATHVEQFAELLGQVHRDAYARRAAVEPVFADTGFFESLRLEPYYAYAAEQTPEARRFLDDLIAATRRRRCTLVHGDYSPKNVLVHDGGLVLLDHEVIHWGDPTFDLGFALTHLLSKAHHLPPHRAAFAEAARSFFRGYRDVLGDVPFARDLEAWTVRHTLGCLLARVAGRSPLEYLDEHERTRQRDAVVSLMRRAPATVDALIEAFVDRVSEGSDEGAPHAGD